MQTHHASWQAHEAKYPKANKGAGSRIAGLTKAFKLLHAAQGCWRRLDAHDLLPLVRAGGGRAQMDTGWNGQSRAQKEESGNGRRLITFNPQLLTYLEELELGGMS